MHPPLPSISGRARDRRAWCRPAGGPPASFRWSAFLSVALALTTLAPVPLVAQAAQSSAGNVLDLTRTLELARRDGPQRQLVDARATSAAGLVRESTQWLNPTFEWRRENLGSSLDPDIFATAYIPFDLTGRRFALRGAGQAGRERVAQDAAFERRLAELHAAEAWLHAAANTELARLMREQATALAELSRVDAVRVREGLVAEAVGLRTSVEADRAALGAVQAERDAAQSLVSLSRVLGFTVAPQTLAAISAPSMPNAPDSAAAIAQALLTRPDLKARDAAVREAGRRLSAEQRGVLGEVQLQGGTKETGGFMTGQVGIAMPLPFFNRNDGARARATGALREATVLQRDALLAAHGDVERARTHYGQVQASLQAAGTVESRAVELVRSARVAYREGHMTLTELLDTERSAVDARTLHRQWLVEAWMTRLTLEHLLGGRLASDSPLDLPLISLPTPDRR